ncbi:MAG: hypothetical protein OEW15_10445 [Nitrospirota bacterium]|nr:hypothetical protein [Nitrospirota bacterium]
MGKKVTYERWINIFLPDSWTEREEMGFVLLEKDNWPGMIQLSFIEREDTKRSPAEEATVMIEDTLEDRDIPFPREAIRVEDMGDHAIAAIDYTLKDTKEPAHWRIWFLVDRTRAILAAYICDPEHDGIQIDEASRIIADMEFIPSMND